MQHLEVGCAVRRFFKSLGFKGLRPIHTQHAVPMPLHAVHMPFLCHSLPLIHTCHAAPLPCSDSVVPS